MTRRPRIMRWSSATTAIGLWVVQAAAVAWGVPATEGSLTRHSWVVDATAAIGGSGAFEAPFSRLGDAERASGPGDRIVVLEGDFEESIELKPHQHLVGRGTAIELEDGSFMSASNAPRIGVGSKPGVVLADGCVVRGLDLRGSPPIHGLEIGEVTIEDVRTTGGEAGGVVLDRAHGSVSISRLEALDSSGHGLAVEAAPAAELILTVRESSFIGHRMAGIDIRAAGGGKVVIENNTIDGNALGLVISHAGDEGVFGADIVGNRVNQELGGSHTALQIFLGGGSTTDSKLEASVSGNVIGSGDIPDSGSVQGQGIELYASGAGRLIAELTDNTVRAIANGSAVRLVSSTHTGMLDVKLRDNDCDVHPSSGFPLAGLELLAGTTRDDRGVLRVDLLGNVAFVGGSDFGGVTLSTVAGQPRVELVGYRGEIDNRSTVEEFLDTAATTVSPSTKDQSTINAGTVVGLMRLSESL